MKRLLAACALLAIARVALAQPEPPTTPARTDTLARVVPLPEVIVSTARPGAAAPIARTTLGRRELLARDWGQDTPMALGSLPGAYAASDAGNGIGYSYLSVRGFPQRRISVLIDGVPLNDPESHEVYWIDHPDLLASTAEVQLQRGVGSALYGAAAVGGTVDLETAPFSSERLARATLAYGAYATRRAMVEMNSGRLAGDWSYYGRYSRIDTDGYRDQSWTHVWSYFLSARKTAGDHLLDLRLFGGPEETHLAYRGVPRATLEGALTGDADRDRRTNPLDYPGEADHFFEPHYELLHTWAPRPDLTLSQTLFWFDGRGYYDERRFDALSAYRLQPWAADTTQWSAPHFDDGYGNVIRDEQGRPLLQRADVVRRRTVANHHYGWVPRLRLEHPSGALVVGGELRAHDGHHWGEVLSGDGLPPGTPALARYYDYHPRTLSGGLFVREEWRPLERLAVTGDLAWRHQRYQLRDDRFDARAFRQRYDFALPRLGATWRLRPDASLFASWSQAEREPRFIDLFNPEQSGSVPLYRRFDPASGTYSDPYVKPERVTDWELGGSLTVRGVTATANLFRMDLRDELVDFQFNADLGNWVTANAARSVHQGLELALAGDGAPRPGLALALDGSLTLADNHFVAFDEQVDAATVVSHAGKAIGFFPATLAHLGARVAWKGAMLGADGRHVGALYVSNDEDAASRIAPHFVLDLSAGYRLPVGALANPTLAVRVFNALDERYETSGYWDYDAAGNYVPLFVPAARRNVQTELRVEF